MGSHLLLYQLALLGLLWLCCMWHSAWPSDHAADLQRLPQPLPPPRKSPRVPKPFPGLTHKPHCAAWAQASEAPRLQPSPPPPPPMTSTRGRRRHVNTSQHFCPAPACRYGGWLGRGNITAKGYPSSGPWRQLSCSQCRGDVLETPGTPLHGNRVAPDTLVWAIGAWAEGLGMRAVARVFGVDPNTVRAWRMEAAEHLKGVSRSCIHDLHVSPIQMDALFALRRALKDGEVSEAEALKRLSRSPHWVWVAMEPVTTLLLTIDVGDRTLAMAQSFVHQVVQL